MKKHLTTLNGQRLMLAGAALFSLCIVLGVLVNWSLAGKMDDCLNQSHACSIGWEQAGANMSTGLAFAGGVIFIVGLATLITAYVQGRKLQ